MVTPPGWTTAKLSEVAEVRTGPFGSALHASDYVIEGTPILTVEHLGEFRLEGEYAPRVSPSDAERLSAYKLLPGDVVFSRVGSIGRFGYVTDSEAGWLFSGRLLRVRIKEACSKFVYYQMCSPEFIKQVETVAVGQTMPSLNTALVNSLSISLPPREEQEAIAAALSNADEQLEQIDTLIEKKKAIRLGLRQQLLTGTIRVSGSSKAWEQVRLEDVCQISTAAAKRATGSQYVIVDMGSVGSDGSLLSHKKTDDPSDLLQINDLVMPKDDIGGGQIIGKAVHIGEPGRYVLGDHVYRIRTTQGDARFIRYMINSHSVNTALRAKVVGSAQLGLGKRAVLDQVIPWPEASEQQAIANVLSELDVEVEALQMLRTKAHLIKQGMTQGIFSGEVRFR